MLVVCVRLCQNACKLKIVTNMHQRLGPHAPALSGTPRHYIWDWDIILWLRIAIILGQNAVI